MGKPLSNDLRSRVVRAVAGGLTRRKAAAQFGVSAASAIRWVEAVRVSGTVEPKPQGGDTRSHRIEAFSAVLLAAVTAQKDITLAELAELLRGELGASFSASSVRRCLKRHGLSYKKNSARRRTGATRRRSPAPPLVPGPA
jgi:transposase